MKQLLVVSRKENISEYLEIANKYNVGFEYNDFFIPSLLDDEAALKETIALYKRSDMPEYCTMHGVFFDIIPFSSDETIRQASIRRMHQSMEIAQELGVKGVVFHTNCYPILSGSIYDEQVVSGSVKALEGLLQEFPEIDIYLENMFDDNPQIMVAIAKSLTSYSNFGLCLDYAHASISTTPVEQWVETVAPYVKHLHINDNDLKKDYHQALGTGLIDWHKFSCYCAKYFKDCSVLIEVTSPEVQIQSLEYFNRAMRDIIESEKVVSSE